MSVQETRQKLDEYLDGASTGGPVDAAEAKLLAKMKSERALRAAVYESYTPSAAESQMLAAEMMAAAHAPVGRVGTWSPLRRLVGVAAAIAILAGTFAAGRMSGTSATAQPGQKFVVVYMDKEGVHSVSSEFDSEVEMKAYVATLEDSGMTVLRADAADTDTEVFVPGIM